MQSWKRFDRALNNGSTTMYKGRKLATVNTFFTGGADELCDDNLNRFAKSQAVTEVLLDSRINLMSHTVSVAVLVKQRAEIAVGSEGKF